MFRAAKWQRISRNSLEKVKCYKTTQAWLNFEPFFCLYPMTCTFYLVGVVPMGQALGQMLFRTCGVFAWRHDLSWVIFAREVTVYRVFFVSVQYFIACGSHRGGYVKHLLNDRGINIMKHIKQTKAMILRHACMHAWCNQVTSSYSASNRPVLTIRQ